MKTLLVLTLLVALVGLGVWNSPKDVHEPAPYVTATYLDKLGGEIQVLSDGTITGQQPWQREGTKEWAEWWGEGTPQWAEYTAGRVKTADEIAKAQAELAEFKSVSETLSGSDDFSNYSPLPADATAAIYEVGDGRSTELEITK